MNYDFNLLSGNYKTTYKLQDGPNPENSTVTTPYYTDHFSDRWLNDQLKVTTAGSSGVDILDRAKAQFAPGNCGRSEDTFDDAEGAFIANKSGPVRAIRSYIGANSGPLTQREHIFYEQREDIRTFLRVHAIPGVMDYFDYSPAASGMTYKNNLNTGGVTIDGTPDTVATAGALTWESVDGGQGGLSIVHTNQTDIAGFGSSSYYFDDSTPGSGAEFQCTGDSTAYGNSGPWITQSIPNTDPRTTPFNSLLATRTLYFEDAGKADGAAPRHAAGRADRRQRHELPVEPGQAASLARTAPATLSARLITPARTPGRARTTVTELAPARPEAVHRLVVRSRSTSRGGRRPRRPGSPRARRSAVRPAPAFGTPRRTRA